MWFSDLEKTLGAKNKTLKKSTQIEAKKEKQIENIPRQMNIYPISPCEKRGWINSTRRSCISFQGAGGYQILKILIPGSAWLVSRIRYFGWCQGPVYPFIPWFLVLRVSYTSYISGWTIYQYLMCTLSWVESTSYIVRCNEPLVWGMKISPLYIGYEASMPGF